MARDRLLISGFPTSWGSLPAPILVSPVPTEEYSVRRITAAAAIVLLTTLGACGGGDDDAPSDSSTSSSSAEDSGDEGDSGDDEVAVLDTCEAVSVEEVGAILGGTFTSELGPFDACEFDQEDPRATSFSLDSQAEAELGGGFESYKVGAASALTNSKTVDVPGVGDDAYITTGTFGDGTNIQLQAATLIDGQVLTVSLTQASDIAEDVLVGQAKELLDLVASKV